MCEEASIRLSWICLLRSTSQSKPYGNHWMHAAHQFNGQPLTNSSIYSEDFMRLDEREKQKIKHSNYVYWRMGREARTINITFCIKIEPSNESNKQIRSMGASWNFVPMTHGSTFTYSVVQESFNESTLSKLAGDDDRDAGGTSCIYSKLYRTFILIAYSIFLFNSLWAAEWTSLAYAWINNWIRVNAAWKERTKNGINELQSIGLRRRSGLTTMRFLARRFRMNCSSNTHHKKSS